MAVRIDHLVTSGTFSLDGGTWDVDNNVWIVGDDEEAIVIDAAHDADAIVAALASTGRCARSSAPMGTTTTSTRPRRWPPAPAPVSICTPPTCRCGR